MSNHQASGLSSGAGVDLFASSEPRSALGFFLFNIWICSILDGRQEKSWIFDVEFLSLFSGFSLALLSMVTIGTEWSDG